MDVISPEQIVAQMDAAFARRDIETLMSFYEPSAAVVAEPGKVVRDRSELRAIFEAAMAYGGSAKQLQTSVIEAEGIALFLSRWTMNSPEGTSDEGQVFIATCVMRKQSDGRWQVLIDNPFGPLVLGSEA